MEAMDDLFRRDEVQVIRTTIQPLGGRERDPFRARTSHPRAHRPSQAALVTLPALMQRVQASTRSVRPSTEARIFWRFGSVRFLVLLFAWLTLLPTSGLFPQTSHFQAMTATP